MNTVIYGLRAETMELLFEWDENKATENVKKHKVNFEEAKTVFNDPFLITFPDEAHSETEDRLISIGTAGPGRVLLIVHTERQASQERLIVRLISGRKATASERRTYEEGED